jgi:hypothetical protein
LFDSGPSELGIRLTAEAGALVARCTKGIVIPNRVKIEPDQDGRELFMALTFGTLLSSQGADAHPDKPRGLLGGNLGDATRSVSLSQTELCPAVPLGGHTQSLGTRPRVATRLEDCRLPAPTRVVAHRRQVKL